MPTTNKTIICDLKSLNSLIIFTAGYFAKLNYILFWNLYVKYTIYEVSSKQIIINVHLS